MLTRTTITESEKSELRNALHKFRQSEVDKEEAATVIADVLGCHVDEAWTAGERREGMERILDRYGIEVAPDDAPRRESLAPMERAENVCAVLLAIGLAGVIVWSLWLWVAG